MHPEQAEDGRIQPQRRFAGCAAVAHQRQEPACEVRAPILARLVGLRVGQHVAEEQPVGELRAPRHRRPRGVRLPYFAQQETGIERLRVGVGQVLEQEQQRGALRRRNLGRRALEFATIVTGARERGSQRRLGLGAQYRRECERQQGG